ncbi:hypothetical protein LV779_04555 [Streptomyces thinghirensis]|nr:hypothetical protein [Streptomyces thinghirensis]
MAAIVWLCVMALLGVGFLVTRKRNAKFAARLRGRRVRAGDRRDGAGAVPGAGGRSRQGTGNPFGGVGGPVAGGAPYGYPQAPPHPPHPVATDSPRPARTPAAAAVPGPGRSTLLRAAPSRTRRRRLSSPTRPSPTPQQQPPHWQPQPPQG